MPADTLPRVSVCVTTFHQDAYIEDCLMSVLLQTADLDLEVLVGDDGTSSGTPAIIERISKKYPGIITYYRHARNLGPAANYQFLIARARGAYVCHLDGDDYWLPGKLRAQTEWLDQHPQASACYANAAVINADGELLGLFSDNHPPIFDFEYLVRRGNFLNHSSLMYRRTAIDWILALPPPFLDFRLHLGLARQGALGWDRRIFVAYRSGSEHSMVRTMPDTVRDLYFRALCETLSDEGVGTGVRCAAFGAFLSEIMMVYLLRLRWATVARWIARVEHVLPGQVLACLGWAVARGVPRAARATARWLFWRFGSAKRLQVFHD